ncbi:MAG: polysaccharide biosynthesis C-terminal domain-containing protein, partial [Candidatus Omnitrophota bacterium]
LFRRNIASFLHLDSLGSITILSLIFFLVSLSSVVTGGLQGLEKFKWLAIVGVVAGLSKLLFSVVLIKSISDTLLAGLSGFLLSTVTCIVLCLWPLRFLIKGRSKEKIEAKQLYVYIFPVLIVSLCFTLVTNIDLVLVKHFFLTEAQDYSIAQMIGKIILFLPGVIYAVMFSRVSGLHAIKSSSREILKRSLFYTFGLSFSAVVVYNLFPKVIFGLLTGQSSREIVLLGRFFSLAMLFYALSNVLFVYQLSVERYNFIWPLVLIALAQIIGICLFHTTTVWVLGIMLAGSVVMFSLNLRSALSKA